MTIRRWEPLGDFMSLRQAMDRLFEDSFIRTAAPGPYVPFDIYETGDAVVVKAHLPGWKPEDVDITITGDVLTIKGQYQEETPVENATWHVRETRQGSFSRTISLPGRMKTDEATANFEHGVLTLTIPKADEVKPRQIKVAARPAVEGTVASTS